jgi:hypothetical protein
MFSAAPSDAGESCDLLIGELELTGLREEPAGDIHRWLCAHRSALWPARATVRLLRVCDRRDRERACNGECCRET